MRLSHILAGAVAALAFAAPALAQETVAIVGGRVLTGTSVIEGGMVVIRDGKIDVVLLGRPALANPHWPVWAARELGHGDPFSLVPEDWSWWLKNFRGHDPSIGLPPAKVVEAEQERKIA